MQSKRKRAAGSGTRSTGVRGSSAMVRLPRVAKGRRPQFHDGESIDHLFAIVTALAGEISVLFDRLDTVQRLLATAGAVPADAIADYVPDGQAAAERAQQRDELLRRVFAVLEVYAAEKAAMAS